MSVSTPSQAAASALALGLTEDKVPVAPKRGFGFLIVALLASLLVWQYRATKVSIPAAGMLLLVLAVYLAGISCGGGSSTSSPGPPPPGPTSYTITVTGTSGSLTNSANLTLIVNP